MVTTPTHVYFWKGYLSQWFLSPFRDRNGNLFNCAEQYMMFQKAMYFNDIKTATKIMGTHDPRTQQELGRAVTGFDRLKWDAVCQQIVCNGNMHKFSQSEELKAKLIKTGTRTLVEASPIDTIWGVGLGENDPLILDEDNWKGTNFLGECLMKTRIMLRDLAEVPKK
jgi:ribA/ribD-fused uncharacterized protein